MEVFHTFGIDWRLLAIQIVNFAILLYVLNRFLYKPVIDILERRREQVKKNLEATEAIQREFAAFQLQKENEFQKARVEAQHMVDAAGERVARIEAKAAEEARLKSADMLERAKKVINEEKGKIVEEAQRGVADLVMAATEKVLGKKLQGKEAEELIRQSLRS